MSGSREAPAGRPERAEPGDGPGLAAEGAPASELTVATARFCRLLRERGVPVTVTESVAALEALESLDLADRREVYLGLRSLLTASVRDYPVFRDAFRDFWDRVGRDDGPSGREIPRPGLPEREAPEPRPRRTEVVSLEGWLRQTGEDDGPEVESGALRAPSRRESLAERDFRDVADDELKEVSRAVRRLARRMARRPGRRWTADRRGSRVHLRRTVRKSLSTGGEAPELVYRSRRPRRTRIVALCDVSGSMDLYSRFLLRFLFALQREFRRVETFVFATRLSRVTDALESDRYRDAVSRVGGEARDFSGGTRIGESLETFLDGWPGLLDRRTVVLVLSDGWETGDPGRLSAAVEEMADRADRVLWLNPLMGAEDYRPATRGMQAVLPHVEEVLPLHNLESLGALTRHLA